MFITRALRAGFLFVVGSVLGAVGLHSYTVSFGPPTAPPAFQKLAYNDIADKPMCTEPVNESDVLYFISCGGIY